LELGDSNVRDSRVINRVAARRSPEGVEEREWCLTEDERFEGELSKENDREVGVTEQRVEERDRR
jgi:hypothetical protein